MDFLPDTRGLRRIKSLLLLYLFVARTLGDCPKPLPNGNIVLSNAALLMNTFPDNVEISLLCANGYIKDGGTGIMKCIDGTWGNADLTCRKKDCGPPPPQPHMNFITNDGTLFGAIIEVTCDTGYSVIGTSYKQCFSTGWSGRSTCEIVICDPPPEISNGRSSWDSTDEPHYAQIIHYSCDEGYTLIGKADLICNEEGEYDAPAPECQRMTTEAPHTTKTTATTPAPETSTVLQDTTTGHKDTTISESATTVSLSARGGRGIFKTEDKTTSTTTSMPSSYQEEREDIVDTNKDVGYTPVIVSVVCVSLVVCIVVFFIHKLLHKRKGSYDTREDLKPELLQFQNL